MAKYSVTGVESGASDLGAIVPVDGEHLFPFGNGPNDILLRHRAAQDGVDTFPASRVMEGGNRFEDAIRKWFEDDFGVKVNHPKKGYRSKRCNLVASLDGLIAGGPFTITDHQGIVHNLVGKGVIDFKCPTYKPDNPEALHYILQVQGQMDCTGADWAIIAYLPRVNLEWVIVVIRRHKGMIEAIHEAVDNFWLRMKLDSDYPPATTTEANRLIGGNRRPDALDLSTKDIDKDCPLDRNDRDQLMNLTESYLTFKTDEKIAKQGKEESQLNICKIMGGVEKIILPDANVNWTTTETRAKEETTKIVPAKPASTSRRFTVKEIINE